MINHVKQYKKRPVVIDALQWNPNEVSITELKEFTNHLIKYVGEDLDTTKWFVYDRLHNTWIEFYYDDYIIKGVQGEFYPCRPDAFNETYEPVKMPLTATFNPQPGMR